MREVIYGATVTLQGVTSLIMHAYNSNKTMDGRNPEEWKEEIYLSSEPTKHLVYPFYVLEKFMQNAAKGQKMAKTPLNKLLARGLELTDTEFPMLVNNKKVTITDIEKNNWLWTTPVKIANAKVPKVRVLLPAEWSITFQFNITEKSLLADSMKRFFEVAGYQEGMGQWRPGSPKPGKFGQFILANFEVAEKGYENLYERKMKNAKHAA